MSHAVILPIILPLMAAILTLAGHRLGVWFARAVLLSCGILLATLSIVLLAQTESGEIVVYALGNWPAPAGIVLVLDRLSALMLALTAAIALPAMFYASGGADAKGRHFHVLFLMQVVGINGAFLAGDLFNLFVFFEVLLLASYGLLVHGGGLPRVRAGLSYVILNLVGSALFLIALGLVYGMLGTLNLADLAQVLMGVPDDARAVVRAACALLAVVFCLKAALLPLTFWLPPAYGSATAPAAAIFAMLTKVGFYSLLRVSVIAFDATPFTADVLQPWLGPLALATIAWGTLGALAARRLTTLVAYLVVISTGTLLVTISSGHVAEGDRTISAALFYLLHTTLASAAFFLLADRIAASRGKAADFLDVRGRAADKGLLGLAFLVLAVTMSGLPPLSGFIAKIMVMRSVQFEPLGTVTWLALILSGLVIMMVMARTASVLFWEAPPPVDLAVAPASAPLSGKPPAEAAAAVVLPTSPLEAIGVGLAIAFSLSLVAGARPIAEQAGLAAAQLQARQPYLSAVLGQDGRVEREQRP